jgi:hypothetical protein
MPNATKFDNINMSSLSHNDTSDPVSLQPVGSNGMQRSFAAQYSSEDEHNTHGLYGSIMNSIGSVLGFCKLCVTAA